MGAEISAKIAGVLLSRRVIQCAHFMGVGVIRVYPALNAAGVDFGTSLVTIFLVFPVAVFLLGALAVFPSTYIGCWIKQTFGLSIGRCALAATGLLND